MLQTSEHSEIMLVELQHRTANVFQLLSGLLRYRLKGITSLETRDELLRVLDAVASLGLLQQRIARSRGANLAEYIRDIVPFWDRLGAGRGIAVRVGQLDELIVGDKIATYLALIVHELITNCFEHAFGDGKAGAVLVEIRKIDHDAGELWIKDDGSGLPVAPQEAKSPRDIALLEHSLGLPLIEKFVQILGGTLALAKNDGGGTAIMIRFPVQ